MYFDFFISLALFIVLLYLLYFLFIYFLLQFYSFRMFDLFYHTIVASEAICEKNSRYE